MWEQLDDEIKYSPIAYPDAEVLANTESFSVLPDEINQAMDQQWSMMKSYNEGGSGWMILVFMAAAVSLNIFVLWRKYHKRKRENY